MEQGSRHGRVGEALLSISYSQNMNFNHVQNPIIIDQHYCDVANKCEKMDTGVQRSDVQYVKAFGTLKTKVTINLNCSEIVPCENILLDSINLQSAVPKMQVVSSCNSAHGLTKEFVQPKSCLEP
ncbi:hypothetical protein SLE2022_312450 [Rubroshorea leprosula]